MRQKVAQLRSDARVNREQMLHAARELFSRHGLEVTTRQIARHANVGTATLYRHFPSRQELVEAAFADEHDICEAIVRQALALENPRDGIRLLIEHTLEFNARNRGFVESAIAQGKTSPRSAGRRNELLRTLTTLITQARRSGRLRADLTLDDLILVFSAGRGIEGETERDRVAAARRFSQLTLDALRASGSVPDSWV
ncbi:TetR/AcrR family transcriptional regulator [Plantibacter sp. VKM Ac-2876]|uniref:TetR/AcrR family transcriptional regulator n=1 Tax=Plantibacter sp. VKM Ac-2876 TaxID=2783826 RepID=UPI00188A2DF1|nr:TetR/AcrR family transcriptional regulator [Plantibacter sp. VKM Ac-2876]MBF4563979.1 TetR/AcrR family transcriptional regulator [Plantibacter sp. VKM Ac-2876]